MTVPIKLAARLILFGSWGSSWHCCQRTSIADVRILEFRQPELQLIIVSMFKLELLLNRIPSSWNCSWLKLWCWLFFRPARMLAILMLCAVLSIEDASVFRQPIWRRISSLIQKSLQSFFWPTETTKTEQALYFFIRRSFESPAFNCDSFKEERFIPEQFLSKRSH